MGFLCLSDSDQNIQIELFCLANTSQHNVLSSVYLCLEGEMHSIPKTSSYKPSWLKAHLPGNQKIHPVISPSGYKPPSAE